MGQKTNPIGLRIAVDKDWRSRWFSPKKEFGNLLNEDLKIREMVRKRLENAAVAQVRIERYANRVRVNIFTARPGIVIGRKGQDIERIRAELSRMTGKEVYIEIQEIRDADTNAQLVAENIAMQMARRVSFRRAMKRAIKLAMDLGVEGIKIRVSGRLGGSELSRVEWYKEGKIPLHTLRANIDYGFAESPTTAGRIGVKVWICKKDEQQAA
ncbi:MAG: 30S ribosomal protein S3 [Kiritimatiellia bacterium]|nr:30S ribosomal protein S3 [Kiritimatiellia bacterium]MDP6631619.1 30S ribosomal protein S3 [Kiritimatiellia bacterium]MDP6810218.1 30S ribosomal protein S3 [Kiritimatiellia bacterium]MDP7022876.1 30S ribosomal protein S3 [Kiritimatiellia bacterium]